MFEMEGPFYIKVRPLPSEYDTSANLLQYSVYLPCLPQKREFLNKLSSGSESTYVRDEPIRLIYQQWSISDSYSTIRFFSHILRLASSVICIAFTVLRNYP